MFASRRYSAFLLFLVFAGCAAVYTPRQPLPIADVVQLAKSGTPPEETIRRIRQSGTAYALRGSDFPKLKAAGVPDPVLAISSPLPQRCSRECQLSLDSSSSHGAPGRAGCSSASTAPSAGSTTARASPNGRRITAFSA